jgi:ribosome-binding factor A
VAEHRRDRVAHLLQVELATLLLREAADPRLRAVTVTGVRVTADLKQARVFVRALTVDVEPKPTLAALRRATPFLRGAVGRGLGLRSVPELRFEWDTVPDTVRRMDALLGSTHAPADDAATREPSSDAATREPSDDTATRTPEPDADEDA